jgi:hypothetical protein
MSRLPVLRALSALALVASLLLLARVPDCDSGTCRMPRSARAACREMGRDCCKSSTERLAHTSAQPQLPDLALAPTGPLGAAGNAANAAAANAAAAARFLPVLHRAVPLAAPAIVQGVGFHTLFAVFLI